MNNTVNERIREIINEMNISDRAFAEKINIPQTTISNLFNRGSEPGYKILSNIINYIEFISPEWLLTGKGSMFKEDTLNNTSEIPNNNTNEQTVKERLISFVRSKDKTIAGFEREIGVSSGYIKNISRSIQPDILENISNIYPDLNIEWLMIGKGSMLKEETVNQDTVKKSRIEDIIDIANDTVIHNRFLDVINSMNLTASDIKLRLGFNLEDIAQIIANRKEMTVKFLQVFCREFSVSSDYILNGIGQAVIERVSSNDALSSTYLAQNAKILSYIESMNNRITNIEERLDKVKEEHRSAI